MKKRFFAVVFVCMLLVAGHACSDRERASDGRNRCTVVHASELDIVPSDYVELLLSRTNSTLTMRLEVFKREYEGEEAITKAFKKLLTVAPRIVVPVVIVDNVTVGDVVAAETLLRRAGVSRMCVSGYYKGPPPEVPKPE